jgi:hypothetical protein
MCFLTVSLTLTFYVFIFSYFLTTFGLALTNVPVVLSLMWQGYGGAKKAVSHFVKVAGLVTYSMAASVVVLYVQFVNPV